MLHSYASWSFVYVLKAPALETQLEAGFQLGFRDDRG